MPRTRLWQRLKNENRLDEGRTDGGGKSGTCDLNFIPNMDRTTLIEGYRELVHDDLQPRPLLSANLQFSEITGPAARGE